MNWAGLDPSILVPAFATGLAVLATHVPLGREVLRRGIIFLDLAVAQIAGLGVIVAGVLFHGAPGLAIQAAALAAALGGALILGWCEKRWPEIQEAIIGSAFVLAASLGLLMLANDPHGGEQVKDLLVGQILWVRWEQVGIATVIAVGVLAVWFGIPRQRSRLFYLLFALAITTAVQLVGIYLVFASLIMPALAAHSRRGPRSDSGGLALGYAVGAGGYVVGLVLSGVLDYPAGPLIVLGLAGVGVVAVVGIKAVRYSVP